MSHQLMLKEAAQDLKAIIKRAIREEKHQLSELKHLHSDNRQRSLSLKRQIQDAKKRSEALHLKIIPFIGARKVATYHHEIEQLEAERVDLDREADIIKRGATECINYVRSLERRAAAVIKYEKAIPRLASASGFLDDIVALQNNCSFHRKSIKEEKARVGLELSQQFCRIIADLYKSNVQRQNIHLPNIIIGRQPLLGDEEKRLAEDHKIYLPISSEEMISAVDRGGIPVYGRGNKIIDVYTTLARDNRDLQNYLPMAYRTRRRKVFQFPDISVNARGQNIHKLFTRETWDRIRKINYPHTNKRCLLCGRQRGMILDRIFDNGRPNYRRVPVDCHEVWEWNQKDAEIGIQKLTDLIVVCVDCHMMFHEDFVVDVAVRNGFDGDEIREYLNGRRRLVNHMDEATLEAQLEQERVAKAERDQVGNWIIDLTHLGKQSYMNFTAVADIPDYMEISPELIAGIEFETTDGIFYEARDAEEIYRSISSDHTVENRRAVI